MSANNINVTVRKRKKIKPEHKTEISNYSHNSEVKSKSHCNKVTPQKSNDATKLPTSSILTPKQNTLTKIKKSGRRSMSIFKPIEKRCSSIMSLTSKNKPDNKKSLLSTPRKKPVILDKSVSEVLTPSKKKSESTLSIKSESKLKTKKRRMSSLFQTPSKTPMKRNISKISTPTDKRRRSVMSLQTENILTRSNKKKRLSSLFQTPNKNSTPYKKRISEISTPITRPRQNSHNLEYGSHVSNVNTDYVAKTNTYVIHKTRKFGHLNLEFHALVDAQGVPLFAKSVGERLLKVILLNDYIQQLYERKAAVDHEKMKKVMSNSLRIVNNEFKKKSEGICSISCVLVSPTTFYLASVGSSSMFLWQTNKNTVVVEREIFRNPVRKDISTNCCIAKTGKVQCEDMTIFEALESSEYTCCCPTVSSISRSEVSSSNKTYILFTTLGAVNPKVTIEDLHKILRSSVEAKRGLDAACENICKMSQSVQDAETKNDSARVAAVALHFDHEPENPPQTKLESSSDTGETPKIKPESSNDAGTNSHIRPELNEERKNDSKCKELILCLGSLQKIEHISKFYD